LGEETALVAGFLSMIVAVLHSHFGCQVTRRRRIRKAG
jgi:hypothetical protein